MKGKGIDLGAQRSGSEMMIQKRELGIAESIGINKAASGDVIEVSKEQLDRMVEEEIKKRDELAAEEMEKVTKTYSLSKGTLKRLNQLKKEVYGDVSLSGIIEIAIAELHSNKINK